MLNWRSLSSIARARLVTAVLVSSCVGLSTSEGFAADTASTLANAGSATPSVGGDIEGQPNLLDLEFLTARFTLRSPTKTLTTVTMAPFLSPTYHPAYAETRIGVFAESGGAFGIGAGWGYNQARHRLANSSPPNLNVTESKDEKSQREAKTAELLSDIGAEILVACETLQACSESGPLPNCEQAAKDAVKGCDPLGLPPIAGKIVLAAISKIGPPASDLPREQAMAARAAYATLVMVRAQLSQSLDAHAEKAVALARKADDASLKTAQLKRLQDAYDNSWGFNVLGAVGAFPIVNAPDVAPSAGEAPQDAFHHWLRSGDAALAVRYNFSRYLLAQARGGGRWDRANAFSDTPFAARVYGAIDVGGFIALDALPDDSGFQRGIGIGASVSHYQCRHDAGCATDPGIGKPYPDSLPLSRRTRLSAFVELRLLKEAQFRLGAEATIDKVKGKVEGTEPDVTDPTIFHLSPTIAVGSSFWGI